MPPDGWLNLALLLLSLDEAKLKQMRDQLGLTASISGVFEELIRTGLGVSVGSLANVIELRAQQFPARRGRPSRTVHVALRTASYEALSCRAKLEGISTAKAALALLWLAPLPAPTSNALLRQAEVRA